MNRLHLRAVPASQLGDDACVLDLGIGNERPRFLIVITSSKNRDAQAVVEQLRERVQGEFRLAPIIFISPGMKLEAFEIEEP